MLELVPKPGRHKKKSEAAARASRANGKLVEWKPELQPKEVSGGVWREETQDEAWERARTLVRHYTAIGYPAEVVCRLVRPALSEPTLRKYFAYELENGHLIANAKMAGTAYQLGVSGRDPAMCRFWLRAQMGWRDRGDLPNNSLEVRFKPMLGDDFGPAE